MRRLNVLGNHRRSISLRPVGRGAVHLKLIRLVWCFSQQTLRDNGKRFVVTADEKTTIIPSTSGQ